MIITKRMSLRLAGLPKVHDGAFPFRILAKLGGGSGRAFSVTSICKDSRRDDALLGLEGSANCVCAVWFLGMIVCLPQ